jgi:hypothetical protein
MEELWKNTYKSICKITHLKNGEALGSGTGFLINGHLVTNNHVYFSQNTDQIKITFVDEDSSSITFERTINYSDFQSKLKEGDLRTGWDFAILDLENDKINNFPSLEFCEVNHLIPIGRQIALLGFPFNQDSLALHGGFVSSKYTINNVDYIQIDASVNKGNSGGPLIDIETGKVIGLVTRKGNGLTNLFDQVRQGVIQSIQYVDQINGVQAQIGGIDLIKATAVTQRQILSVFNEIDRSANVGIGYAFGLKEVRKYFE